MNEYAGREKEIEALERLVSVSRGVGLPRMKALEALRDAVPALLTQLREARKKLAQARKQVVGQKGTLHKVKNKWDVSRREGERLAAALAHLLAWVQPSASQQAEAEVETAIEELEEYRRAHPRLDRILKGGD